ncbi:MAG: hypothetical protein HYV63_20420 [Candidatus Schekmanbacteria bacterium]|nr:hypothetical protein [Candidatus Schekmanbacteria bacterium]
MRRTPEDLEAHVTNAVALFEQNPVAGEDALETPFDSARVASGLREWLTELRGGLGATARERRELESAMTERDRSLVAWNDVYQEVATAWSALFRLAGEVELAERMRPTVRRAAPCDQGNLDPPSRRLEAVRKAHHKDPPLTSGTEGGTATLTANRRRIQAAQVTATLPFSRRRSLSAAPGC